MFTKIGDAMPISVIEPTTEGLDNELTKKSLNKVIKKTKEANKQVKPVEKTNKLEK